MKLYIRAFADSQAEIYRDIKSKSSVVIEHLIKLFLYPNSNNLNHWKTEIFAAMSRVPKLKRTKKYTESKNILKYSWNIWNDSIADMIDVIQNDYGLSNTPPDIIYNNVHIYLAWISDKLSRFGYVTSNQIYSKIDDLIQSM